MLLFFLADSDVSSASNVDRETLAAKERVISSASDVNRETLAAKESSNSAGVRSCQPAIQQGATELFLLVFGGNIDSATQQRDFCVSCKVAK